MYHVRTQIFPQLLYATDKKIAQYNNAIHLHIPLFLGKNPHLHILVFFGKNPMKNIIFICIFGDSRKSKKSAISLICLYSDMSSIWQNSMQVSSKIIKP